MAKLKVRNLSVADLVALRDEVQAALAEKIGKELVALQKQIESLTKLESGSALLNGDGTGLPKRRTRRPRNENAPPRPRAKVEPKYRGPTGETWTGRGRPPRWLAALEATGEKRDTYLIPK